MPVRSSRSPVLKWPDAKTVDRAVRRWAKKAARSHANVQRIGYFGSYARGDWGVGSDLDLIVVVQDSDRSFEHRGTGWRSEVLPVPADLLIYTEAEFSKLKTRGRFGKVLADGVVWVYEAGDKRRHPPRETTNL